MLRGQDQVFFFDVTNPRSPEFIRSDNPPGASITDEFVPLKNGGFLVTFMGGATGANPGHVVEYDDETRYVATWPVNPPEEGFNPHGVAIDEARNLMLTSDFICPLRTLHVHGGGVADVRGSVRVWDLAPGGIVDVEGDHRIHVINVHGDRLERDRRFDVDFDRDISTGPARPHGVVALPSRHRR